MNISESMQTTVHKPVEVAVGLVFDESGKILIGQRSSPREFKGKWEFPGGKIEPFETTADALKRELKEELGVVVQNSTPFMSFDFQYPHLSVLLNFEKVYDFDGVATALAHQKIRWVEVDELSQYDMLQGSLCVVERLKQEWELSIQA